MDFPYPSPSTVALGLCSTALPAAMNGIPCHTTLILFSDTSTPGYLPPHQPSYSDSQESRLHFGYPFKRMGRKTGCRRFSMLSSIVHSPEVYLGSIFPVQWA
jgi:hypothetical protein